VVASSRPRVPRCRVRLGRSHRLYPYRFHRAPASRSIEAPIHDVTPATGSSYSCQSSRRGSMRKRRFADEQIIAIPQDSTAGGKTGKLFR